MLGVSLDSTHTVFSTIGSHTPLTVYACSTGQSPRGMWGSGKEGRLNNWDGWPFSGGYTISGCNQPTRSTQPCLPPGSLNQVPASAGVKAGMSPLPGWQVILCDPIWHVSSRSGEASCELLYSVYLYLYLYTEACTDNLKCKHQSGASNDGKRSPESSTRHDTSVAGPDLSNTHYTYIKINLTFTHSFNMNEKGMKQATDYG